jgi:hypothetical protein
MAAASQAAFGDGTRDPFALYDRALAAGMTQQQAAQALSSGVPLEQFEQEIARLESSAANSAARGNLGDPVYSPARTRDTDTASVQRGVEQLAAEQAAALQASRQLTPEQQALEDRYGNDMAWNDPSFQRTAVTAPQITTQDALKFGTTADPAAAALQRQTIDSLIQRANAGPSAGEADALGLSRNAITQLFDRAGRGATADERSNLDLASGAARDLLRLGAEGATSEEEQALADQRRAMDAMFGDYEQGASDVELEAQGTQREAMNELMGVWKGGGATALERARRAQARAESENWLLGQRKADMQDLAERGRSGGGAELAALAQDRQAAASRLSKADLETDAALEERAMQALLSGSGVAGEMLAGEGSIQDRRLQQLTGASGAARGISGTLGGIEDRRTAQITGGGGMAGDVADAYGNIEDRSLSALQGASSGSAALAGNYGNIESRAIQALLGAQSGASDMRAGADAYVGRNADRMLDAATFNADAINRSNADNQAFIQNAYRDMIEQRTRWDAQTRELQTAVARDLLASDVGETQFGFGQGFDTAASDVRNRNNAQTNYNTSTLGAYTGMTPAVVGAAADQSAAGQAGLRTGGQTFQQAGNAVANYFSGGMAGMAGGGGRPSSTTNPTDDQNPYRTTRY